jgi:5-methylcytosine-specific restriction endonuclease McrA
MKNLTQAELLEKTKNLVAQERRITLELIEHLREVDRRLLHAELGYGSLWEFCTKELGLSEGAAQRRISAMRLLRDVPEAREALESGRLSLSNAAKIQTVAQAARKMGAPIDKKEAVRQVEHLSQRECEQKLFELAPQALPTERERIVSSTERELRLIIPEELHAKLTRLKELLSHAIPDATTTQLLDRLASDALARLERDRNVLDTAAAAVPATKLPPGVRGALPAPVKRAVWTRASGRCEFAATEGRRCSSRHRLEIDHRMPLARGGSNELANLRLLCREHQLVEAERTLGLSPP